MALLGQSMGGSAAICAGYEMSDLTALVVWAPDPNIESFSWPKSGYIEENGQRVHVTYWQEAYAAKVADKLRNVEAPAYIVQCTADEYVDEQNRNAILSNAQSHHQVVIFEGYTHSKWSFEQSEEIINKSVDFIAESFKR